MLWAERCSASWQHARRVSWKEFCPDSKENLNERRTPTTLLSSSKSETFLTGRNAAGDTKLLHAEMRLVQFTPPGSGCSTIFGKNVTARLRKGPVPNRV